jgi:acetate---CoA ligase (ADP-forming)
LNRGADASSPGERFSESLARLLRPGSVAVVGAKDQGLSSSARSLLDSDVEVHVVSRSRRHVWGQQTLSRLADIGRPVDAVMSYLPAEATIPMVTEAIAAGAGGLVSVASGFADAGPGGVALQRNLKRVCDGAGFAVVGPNGIGYADVGRRLHLSLPPDDRAHRRSGGLSFVSQSGAMLTAATLSAAGHRAIGLKYLISGGNEAVIDMADYVDFLAEDLETKAIGLIIEQIRRPERFFEAARKAAEHGKPLVALKLGRSSRGRQIAQSHTGALTREPWVYDAAFRQAGIGVARDVDELVDRLQFFDQIPRARWTSVSGAAVIGMSGGTATHVSDLAEEESVSLPQPNSLRAFLKEGLPDCEVVNPLDFHGRSQISFQDVLGAYLREPELQALVLNLPLAEVDVRHKARVEELAGMAAKHSVPIVVANLAGMPAEFVDEARGDLVAIGRGLRGTLRGLQTMGEFVRHQRASPHGRDPIPARDGWAVPRDLVRHGPATDGLVTFEACLGLLRRAGIPSAPVRILGADDDGVRGGEMPFGPPFVVKVADIPHRSQVGAVRLGVSADALQGAVADMRALAKEHKVRQQVAVQPQLAGRLEVILGFEKNTELGPMILCGLGGVAVEQSSRVTGRLLPLSPADAADLARQALMPGYAGREDGLPMEQELTQLVMRLQQLAMSCISWLQTLDINPLIWTPEGFVAVDALAFAGSADE